jgi:hypothetical protein
LTASRIAGKSNVAPATNGFYFFPSIDDALATNPNSAKTPINFTVAVTILRHIGEAALAKMHARNIGGMDNTVAFEISGCKKADLIIIDRCERADSYMVGFSKKKSAKLQQYFAHGKDLRGVIDYYTRLGIQSEPTRIIDCLVPENWTAVHLFDHQNGGVILGRKDAIAKVLALCDKRGFGPQWLQAKETDPLNLYVQEDQVSNEVPGRESLCIIYRYDEPMKSLRELLDAHRGTMTVKATLNQQNRIGVLVEVNQVIKALGDEVDDYREITDAVPQDDFNAFLEHAGISESKARWTAWENLHANAGDYHTRLNGIVFISMD